MDLNSAIAMTTRLEAAIANALENEVARAVINEMREVAEKKVYSYQNTAPIFAKSRRKASGGLTDEMNIISHVVGGNTLIVDNVTPLQNLWGGGHSETLASIVEEGSKRFRQPYPRPFMEDTKEAVIDKGKAEAALKAGLRRQGIDVEGLDFKFE